MSSIRFSARMSNSEQAADASIRRLVTSRAGREWCLFVDRDGVINRKVADDYVRQWNEFEWMPSVRPALKILRDWAPHLVVVTNQQGIGKGLMSIADLDDIHGQIKTVLAEDNVVIDSIRSCPHLESAGCSCRKPRPGLVLDWLANHPAVDQSLSVVVGDSACDFELSRQVALVTGKCTSVQVGGVAESKSAADLAFDSLWEFAIAVERILKGEIPN